MRDPMRKRSSAGIQLDSLNKVACPSMKHRGRMLERNAVDEPVNNSDTENNSIKTLPVITHPSD